MSDLVETCETVASAWFHVWELGREAMKCPNGPSEDEVLDALDKALTWCDIVEQVRART